MTEEEYDEKLELVALYLKCVLAAAVVFWVPWGWR